MHDELTRDLRTLLAIAGPHCEAGWLAQVAEALVAALTELEHRRRLEDPRRLRTLTLARRVQAAAQSMATLPAAERNRALQCRFGLHRTRVYELLQVR